MSQMKVITPEAEQMIVMFVNSTVKILGNDAVDAAHTVLTSLKGAKFVEVPEEVAPEVPAAEVPAA